MLHIKEYEEALAKAMVAINAQEWYAALNGHHYINFTMWTLRLHGDTVKVFF